MSSCARRMGLCVFYIAMSLAMAHAQGPLAYGESPETAEYAPVEPARPTGAPQASPQLFLRHRIAITAKASTLGGGFELSRALTARTNFRAGFNIFRLDHTFRNGINYVGHVNLNTLEMHYDVFPWAGRFHIGPGMLIYLGTPITAKGAVPGGQEYDSNGQTAYSDRKAPITGNGEIRFNRFAPLFSVGWSNLLSSNERKRFRIPFEIGVVYQGAPKADFRLTGNLCDASGTQCRSVAEDSDAQRQLRSEQAKLNRGLSSFKLYPIISVGFAYTF